MPHGPRSLDPVDVAIRRDHQRAAAPHGPLVVFAVVAAVLTPALAAAAALRETLGWDATSTGLVLIALGLGLGLDRLRGWSDRRTGDPARSPARYARVFGAGYGAALAVLAAVAWAGRSWLSRGAWAGAVLAGGAAAGLCPFLVTALAERHRPGWLREGPRGPGSGAPAA